MLTKKKEKLKIFKNIVQKFWKRTCVFCSLLIAKRTNQIGIIKGNKREGTKLKKDNIFCFLTILYKYENSTVIVIKSKYDYNKKMIIINIKK